LIRFLFNKIINNNKITKKINKTKSKIKQNQNMDFNFYKKLIKKKQIPIKLQF